MRTTVRVMEEGRFARWRFLLWPVVALAVVLVLFSVTPPDGPGCPSVWNAAQEHGHGMGPRFYDCRTFGEQTDATIRWAFLSLLIGCAVLFAGWMFELRTRREHRA